MEVCEQASGARMHTALYRPFSFDFSIFSGTLLRELGHFLTRCGRSLAGAFLGLLNNRGLKSRLSFVGQLSLAKARAHGVTGLIARSCGGLYDLRLQAQGGYTHYRSLAFRLFLGRRGDNLDRFLLRVKEVAEAFRLLSQCMQALTPQPASVVGALSPVTVSREVTYIQRPQPQPCLASLGRCLRAHRVHPGVAWDSVRHAPARAPRSTTPALQWLEPATTFGKYASMEALIAHFRSASEGWPLQAGFAYAGVESPKGEVGVTLVSGGGSRPYRVKLRTPVSHNMHLIPVIGVGATFADFVATFCSLDIVMGEIDR